ncbi:MAG: phosphodiester glycosidase family protein [bacterium]
MATSHPSHSPLLAFLVRQRLRFAVYFLLLLLCAGSVSLVIYARHQNDAAQKKVASDQVAFSAYADASKKYRAFVASIDAYAAQGIEVSEATAQEPVVKALLKKGDYKGQDAASAHILATLETALTAKKADDAAVTAKAEQDAAAAGALEAQKAVLSGKVTESAKPVEGVTLSLVLDSVATTATTAVDGTYTARIPAGTYALTVSKSGYVSVKQTVALAATQQLSKDIAITKTPPATPRPTATPTPAVTQSNGFSSYERKTVATSRGSFSISLLTVDLGSGKAKVATDTGNDSDCSNGCAAKSLQSYVQANGGFGGINGTYFCPPDYADCSGKTNSFLYKVKNTRVGVMINQNNGSFEPEPFIGFDSSGTARYFSSWTSYKSSGFAAYAGVNSGPRLVEGGSITLQDSEMDDKQRSTKSNRGALGLKGQTVYAVVASSATVPDLAAIMDALGVDSAMNLDGGGSSALYYQGAYKVGPGRALPNAIVFVAR